MKAEEHWPWSVLQDLLPHTFAETPENLQKKAILNKCTSDFISKKIDLYQTSEMRKYVLIKRTLVKGFLRYSGGSVKSRSSLVGGGRSPGPKKLT